MCGFAGEFLLKPGRANLDVARAMAARVAHRGPDEQGEFLSNDGRCAMAFHRLSVIDPAGSHQPMTGCNGLVTVAFNGVIYNYRQLRAELASQGALFRTAGDTEVLLHLYGRHGPAMLDRLDGMFALAIYDAGRDALLLARDRFGEKPLWYAPLGDRVVFGSEAKALVSHPMVSHEHDVEALTYYLTVGYIPSPRSAFRALRKLPPASFLVVDGDLGQAQRYWAPQTVSLPTHPADQLAAARDTVTNAVTSRLVSDVPVGVLLSGGLDSSIVTAVMARAAGTAGGVRTFTAGFADASYDERRRAKLVAEHCGTDHAELLVEPISPQMIAQAMDLFDEPFADSSALPTWLVCRAAREHVKVALVGDGGDEAFAGYDRYRALHLAERMGPITYWVVRLAGAVAGSVAPHDEKNAPRRLARFAGALPYPFARQYFMYRSLFDAQRLSGLLAPEFQVQANLDGPEAWFEDLYEETEAADEAARAQLHDLATYLPDDLLVKSDTVSMACGLELRAPMLDHKAVELGLALPTAGKIRGRRGKAILCAAFRDMLPREVLEAPKRGFGIPLGRWLREDLSGMLRETLLEGSLANGGILRKDALAGLIAEHLSGRADHGHRLWALLVLARWVDRQR